jgi:hypothetical protein
MEAPLFCADLSSQNGKSMACTGVYESCNPFPRKVLCDNCCGAVAEILPRAYQRVSSLHTKYVLAGNLRTKPVAFCVGRNFRRRLRRVGLIAHHRLGTQKEQMVGEYTHPTTFLHHRDTVVSTVREPRGRDARVTSKRAE